MPWKEMRSMIKRCAVSIEYQKKRMSVADLCRAYGSAYNSLAAESIVYTMTGQGQASGSKPRPHSCSHADAGATRNTILVSGLSYPSLVALARLKARLEMIRRGGLGTLQLVHSVTF